MPGTRAPSLGVGDELFPDLGSADVDVVSYDLHLTISDDTERIDATVTIVADVTDVVDVVALDAVGLDVENVTIDGTATTFSVADPELLIDLPAGRANRVTAVVDYGFVPTAGRSAVGLPVGWIPGDGRSYVLNEPDGARTWMPANDHPSDKATWRFEVDVPDGLVAAANGALAQRGGDGRPWIWVQDEAMSTYLVQMIVGRYEIFDGGELLSIDGDPIELTHVVPSGDRATFDAAIDVVDDQIAFYEDHFGPFPFERYGLAFVDDLSNLAMETQGRSMFGADDFAGDAPGNLGFSPQLLLGHELAHQWFGDAVGPEEWTDIWLNESFATYAQWMWLEHVGLQPLDAYADSMLQQRQGGSGSTGRPTLDDMFGFNRYDGGAVVLHALRLTIGDDLFFELLSGWVADNVGTTQSTQDFVDRVARVSGRDLDEFFDTWLFAETLPASYPT